MQRYIAFISGLPAGPAAVSQETQRNLFMKLGFLGVEPHGTTGNVAFETSPVGVIGALEAQISRHLRRSISGDIWTFIRTPEELGEIAQDLPFRDTPEGAAVFVVLLNEPLDERTALSLSHRRTATDRLYPRGREIYWVRQDTGDGGPPLKLGNVIDAHLTLRSLKLIERLAKRYGSVRSRGSRDITESERSRL